MPARQTSYVETIRVRLICLGLWTTVALGPAVHADYFSTPLPMNNRSPLTLLFIAPTAPDYSLNSGAHEISSMIDISSHSLIEVAGNSQLELDGETLRLSLTWQYRPTAKWQLRAELPWLSHSGGVLDTAIDNWHKLTGLPEGQRDRQPTDRLFFGFLNDDRSLEFRSRRQGIGDIVLNSAIELHDTALSVTASGWQHTSWLQFGVKLPTGSADRLTGSDATDVALSFHHHREQRTPRPWSLSLDAYAIHAGHSDLIEPVERTQWQLNVKAALQWSETVTPEAQLRYRSATYKSPVPALGDDALGIDVGISLLRRSGIWRFGVSEDVDVDSNPDVSLYLQYTHR